jgi:hypothetical protein
VCIQISSIAAIPTGNLHTNGILALCSTSASFMCLYSSIPQCFALKYQMDHKSQNLTVDSCEQLLIEMAIESWRFARVFHKALTRLDAGGAERYMNQLRYFERKVEEKLHAIGLTLVNVEGQPFDPGIAADPVNLADFPSDVPLLVDHMIEPIIMSPTGLKKAGTVMLRKAHV